MEALQPDGMVKPEAPYSPVVVTDGLVYTAGQVAFDAEGNVVSDDITVQTRQVFENIRRCLDAAGCGFADVVKVLAFLSDMRDFEAYNEVYRQYFSEPYPARSTVQVTLGPGLKVEIEVIARKPS